MCVCVCGFKSSRSLTAFPAQWAVWCSASSAVLVQAAGLGCLVGHFFFFQHPHRLTDGKPAWSGLFIKIKVTGAIINLALNTKFWPWMKTIWCAVVQYVVILRTQWLILKKTSSAPACAARFVTGKLNSYVNWMKVFTYSGGNSLQFPVWPIGTTVLPTAHMYTLYHLSAIPALSHAATWPELDSQGPEDCRVYK